MEFGLFWETVIMFSCKFHDVWMMRCVTVVNAWSR